jgi:hypothetical protein
MPACSAQGRENHALEQNTRPKTPAGSDTPAIRADDADCSPPSAPPPAPSPPGRCRTPPRSTAHPAGDSGTLPHTRSPTESRIRPAKQRCGNVRRTGEGVRAGSGRCRRCWKGRWCTRVCGCALRPGQLPGGRCASEEVSVRQSTGAGTRGRAGKGIRAESGSRAQRCKGHWRAPLCW